MLATGGGKGRNRSFPPVNGPICLGGWLVNDNLHFFCNVPSKLLILRCFFPAAWRFISQSAKHFNDRFGRIIAESTHCPSARALNRL